MGMLRCITQQVSNRHAKWLHHRSHLGRTAGRRLQTAAISPKYSGHFASRGNIELRLCPGAAGVSALVQEPYRESSNRDFFADVGHVDLGFPSIDLAAHQSDLAPDETDISRQTEVPKKQRQLRNCEMPQLQDTIPLHPTLRPQR